MNSILIGNGKSILGRSLGSKIDDFDNVIRLNNFKIKGFEDDLGKKTTIHARRCCDDVENTEGINVVGFITYCTISNGMRIVSDTLRENYGSKYEEVSLRRCMEIHDKIGLEYPEERASVGVLAVEFFWRKFGVLSITGFDLLYDKNVKKMEKYWGDKPVDSNYHNFWKEARYIKGLVSLGVVNIV